MKLFNIWTLSLWIWIFSIIVVCFVPSVKNECSSYFFKCGNDHCIPLSWQCDDENDCNDNSDEVNCETKTCSPTEFKCNNEKCIPDKWQCDLEDDCGDNSDEDVSVCRNKTCAPDEFECKSITGACIPVKWLCDGQEDCKDGSDEKNCSKTTCTSEEFTCDNNRCITKRWVCDEENDCGDRSDEKNCPNVTCSSQQFMCDTGKCIPERWRCDGSIDCTDNSDERDCPTNAISSCNHREFMCANGRDCIPLPWQCDGETDCPDKSDELNCTNTCRPDQFQCNNLHCIPGQLQCNGQKECRDGSDEENCGESNSSNTCDEKTQFHCGRNHCISINLTCDGKNDCGSWEDEPQDKCNITECENNNGGCSQKCIDKPIGYYCDCKEGYKLVDNRSCEDIDECDVPGYCSQLCINTKGSFKCECIDGYILEPNNHHRCRAMEGRLSLIFASHHDIRKFDLETEEYKSLVENLYSKVYIDYVFHTGMLIWSDSQEKSIKSAPIDTGKPIMKILSEDISISNDIAVDWIYFHIYWTNADKNTINIADMSGKMRKTLIHTGNDKPRAIVVNPLEGWVFWTDYGETAKIERAGMDGSHRQTIVSSDVKWPTDLALDFVNRRIFWVDAKLHIICSADYNGQNHQVVFSSEEILKHPSSIDVFEDWVYWTDEETKTIHRANKFNGKEMRVFNGIFSPMDVHVYHSYKQPEGKNYCETLNGHCSHLCLPSPNITERSARFSCNCPDGMTLMKDLRTCIFESTTLVPTSLKPVSHVNNSTEIIPTKAITSMASSPVVNGQNATMVELRHRKPSDADTGKVAGIIIGILAGITIIITLVSFFIYKQYLRRNVTSMNFDNPVYRKTTEDQFSLEKNQYQPARSYPPSLEPLTSPGTNEFV